MRTGPAPLLPLLVLMLACGNGDVAEPEYRPAGVRVELDRGTIALVQGDTIRLRLLLVASDSTRTPVTATSWASSNTGIADVDRNGLVTARAAGQAQISARIGQDSAKALVIVQPSNTTRFVEIAAGGGHTCASARDGSAYCWGTNNFGQIGASDLASSSSPVAVPVDAHLGVIAAGARHSCAVVDSGGVLCWGANSAGQLGTFDSGSKVSGRPVLTQEAGLFTAITVASGHGCALDRAGVLSCWGMNTLGQLGRGEPGVVQAPEPVETGVRFSAASAGQGHTCAIAVDGAAWCWGGNEAGQVGSTGTDQCGNVPCVPRPARVGTNLRFTSITTGFGFSCGLTASGEAWCWGANAEGQLGNGTTTGSITPVRVQGPAFVSIDAGDHHACALTAAGEAWCWGQNLNGQLGRNDNSSALPVRAGVPVLARISAGSSHTCGLTPGGAAFCWGDAALGRLGLNRL